MAAKYVLKYDPIVAGDTVREYVLNRLIKTILEMDVDKYGFFNKEQTDKIIGILGLEISSDGKE